jgi:hypothetical protein
METSPFLAEQAEASDQQASENKAAAAQEVVNEIDITNKRNENKKRILLLVI